MAPTGGIDWAAEAHEVCITDEGQVVERFAAAHGKSDRFDAYVLAELGDCRERYPTEAAMAADAGMSPVALESGKLRVATFRRARDKRLRTAVARLADSTRHWHPWAREVYRRARARGQDHPHAIRTLGRAWIRVGSGFSGAAGRTGCLMTRLVTATSAVCRRQGVDTGRLMRAPVP
jgi:hypothetical protein